MKVINQNTLVLVELTRNGKETLLEHIKEELCQLKGNVTIEEIKKYYKSYCLPDGIHFRFHFYEMIRIFGVCMAADIVEELAPFKGEILIDETTLSDILSKENTLHR